MVSNQVLAARLAAGLATVSLALTGCSMFHHKAAPAAPQEAPAAATSAPAAETRAAPQMTATEAAIQAAGSEASAPAPAAPAVAASAGNPTAAESYVVKRGDTLWGIANMFLKDPWLWPEVWIINPKIPNPHLIYPGDTLALAYGSDGSPQVSVAQYGAARAEARLEPSLRSAPLGNAIPTLPYASIQGFLSHPTLLSKEQIKAAPYVVAFRDMHQVAGSNNEVYVSSLTAEQNSR